MNKDLCHHVCGTPCAYALQCEGDEEAPHYVYVGSTCDIQKRMAQHTGYLSGGSVFCKAHKPVSVLIVVPCVNVWQAVCTESALFGLYLGLLKDENRVRGSRYNMKEKLKFPIYKSISSEEPPEMA